jgi:hypothetical protein
VVAFKPVDFFSFFTLDLCNLLALSLSYFWRNDLCSGLRSWHRSSELHRYGFLLQPTEDSWKLNQVTAKSQVSDGRKSQWERKSNLSRFWWNFRLTSSLRELRFSAGNPTEEIRAKSSFNKSQFSCSDDLQKVQLGEYEGPPNIMSTSSTKTLNKSINSLEVSPGMSYHVSK